MQFREISRRAPREDVVEREEESTRTCTEETEPPQRKRAFTSRKEALREISRNFRETTAPLRGALPPLRGDGRRFLTVTTAPLEGGATTLDGGGTLDGGTTTFPYHNYGPP